MSEKDTGRSAIGGTNSIGSQQQGNITHNVMTEQLVKELQSASKSAPGTDFLVIQQVRQGEQPRIWSTGDPEQTQALFRNAYESLALQRQPAVG